MKKLLLVLLFVPFVSFGQVKKSEISIDRETAREELKNIGEELKIIVTNDYDPDRSLTIDEEKFWRVDKKATVLFEDSMFNEGFFITDASSIDERFKISKEGGLFDEGEIAIGKTKKYTSAYVIRFAKNKKQTRGLFIKRPDIAGQFIKSGLRLISDLELRIIDLSQSGKIVARVSFFGKAIKEKILFPIIAKELRAKIVEIESSKSNDKKEFINRDEAIKRIKEAKDLFETGILSQEEYDKLVAKYKAIIMAN